MERVLMILPGLNVSGGMESFIMNYYRNIDRSKINFDFIAHDISQKSYIEEIKSLGGRVYKFPHFSLSSYKEIKEKYKKLLNQNNYKIVHCNMPNASFLYLKEAKKMCVPARILHSHESKPADKVTHAIRNVPLITYGKKFANYNLACSDEAGKYLFKNRPYTVIRNAIDYQTFQYDENVRKIKRKELEVDDSTFVIGHTGRLTTGKNQAFLIDVFKLIVKQQKNVMLVLVGEGNDLEKLKRKVFELHLEDKVRFLGSRSDVAQLLQAFDVFVFPSIYEGLGMSALEAQAANLPCICSTGVPKEANISGKVIYLNLNDGKEKWVKAILSQQNYRRNIKVVLDDRYDIKKNANTLLNFYMSLLGGE